MQTVIEDITEGSGYDLTATSAKLVKVYSVKITDDAGNDIHKNDQFMLEAAKADGNGVRIPSPGDALEADGTLQVSGVSIKPKGNLATVTVTYERLSSQSLNIDDNGPLTLDIEANVSETQTQFDAYGRQIITKHLYTDKLDSAGQPRRIEQAGTVIKQEFVMTVRLSRRERSNPFLKCKGYTGAVNSSFYLDGQPHTWLCKIRANAEKGDQSWLVAYELTYREDTWDATVIATHPDTGEKVVNPIEGEGLITVPVQRERDFTALNLGGIL